MNQIVAAKRPAEIVRDYIEAEFFGARATPDGRLPTIHEFATHLDVGTSTVRSVVKSLVAEGKLTTVAGKGTFLTSEAATAAPSLHNCLGINVSTDENLKDWTGSILLGAINEALKASMMITALDTVRMPNPGLKDIRKALQRVDGVIAFPGKHHHTTEIQEACQEKNLPLVLINPPYFRETSNFVSNDYFTSCLNLALAWQKTGRRKVVLLFESPVRCTPSSEQIYSAFSLVYGARSECKFAVLDGELLERDKGDLSSHADVGYRRMKHYLEKYENTIDAVYCFGDFLAQGAVQALLEAGLRIPHDVSIAAGTGLDLVHFPFGPLVTLKQPMRQIGESAARMLIHRARHQSIDMPGIYLMPELSEGATIRHEERTAFEQLASRKGERL